MKDRLSTSRPEWWLVALACVCLGSMTATGTPQHAGTVWDGVYTETQAKDGEAVYTAVCAECHGDDHAGREQAPALAGLAFMEKWNKGTVRQLYDLIVEMPPDNPKTLEPKKVVDVLAYLLRVNEFPPGATPLTNDRAALAQIQMTKARPQK